MGSVNEEECCFTISCLRQRSRQWRGRAVLTIAARFVGERLSVCLSVWRPKFHENDSLDICRWAWAWAWALQILLRSPADNPPADNPPPPLIHIHMMM